MGAAALVVGLVIGISVVFTFGDYEAQTTDVSPIVALADATHTDGHFYLFGGSVDSEPVYRYYYETGSGYRMGWKPASHSYIVETNDERPRVEKIEHTVAWSWLFLEDSHDPTYIFYVPPGTVTNTFDLDLNG